jgi:hypothetical protein
VRILDCEKNWIMSGVKAVNIMTINGDGVITTANNLGQPVEVHSICAVTSNTDGVLWNHGFFTKLISFDIHVCTDGLLQIPLCA